MFDYDPTSSNALNVQTKARIPNKDRLSQYEYAVREIMTDSHILQCPKIGNSAMSQKSKIERADCQWRPRENLTVCHHTELIGSSKGQGAASTCVDVAEVDGSPAISIVRMSLKLTPGLDPLV